MCKQVLQASATLEPRISGAFLCHLKHEVADCRLLRGLLLHFRVQIVPASDSSLLVCFANDVNAEAQRRVLALLGALQAVSDPRIRNFHPAYSSLLIDFDPLALSHDELASTIRSIEQSAPAPTRTREVLIPVCYGPEFAPDLPFVASATRMSEDAVIRTHSAGEYIVYFLGFAPGFAYLGGLAPELHVQRHASPRTNVPAGSVGLAGAQTGVYPFDSPGGWQIIGRTPLRMFNAESSWLSRLMPGDVVRFQSISKAEYVRASSEQL